MLPVNLGLPFIESAAISIVTSFSDSAAALFTLSITSGGHEDIIKSALQHFREQPFYYTRTPPLLLNNPVDEFLFDSLRGFCEHYASSFVYLMRASGIPARVVTGYQGGEKARKVKVDSRSYEN